MMDDSALRKPLAKYKAAADDLAAAITAGSLLAATQVAAADSGRDALQALHAEIRREAVVRKVLDSAGRVVSAGVLASLPGPWSEDSFNAAVWTVGKLLLGAWQARGGDQ
jgi:hypothetical protein